MTIITSDALLAFMKKNNYEAAIQPDTGQVYTILKIEKKEYPLFLRIFDGGNLLQLLVFIPSYLQPYDESKISSMAEKESQEATIADIARLLHLFNKELDLPGFGMDEMAGIVFYRLMLPTPKKKVEDEVLAAFLKTMEKVCQMFSVPIEAISSGKMPLNEVLTKAKEMEKSS